jgi:hypothetical protein
MKRNANKQDLNNVWITSGIFSNHYLLERLPQKGCNLYRLTDEKIEIADDLKILTKWL